MRLRPRRATNCGGRHSHRRSRALPAFSRRVLPVRSNSASSGPLVTAPSPVLRAAQDHRYRQRSSAPGPVRATRRPSLVLQRSRFSRREGASPLRSRGGHHSSRRTSLRQPGQAPAQPVSRRPAMPSPTASRFTAAPSVRNPFDSPRAIGLRRATPSACSGTHTNFNGRT